MGNLLERFASDTLLLNRFIAESNITDRDNPCQLPVNYYTENSFCVYKKILEELMLAFYHALPLVGDADTRMGDSGLPHGRAWHYHLTIQCIHSQVRW